MIVLRASSERYHGRSSYRKTFSRCKCSPFVLCTAFTSTNGVSNNGTINHVDLETKKKKFFFGYSCYKDQVDNYVHSAGFATKGLPGTGSLTEARSAIITLTVAHLDGTVAEGK